MATETAADRALAAVIHATTGRLEAMAEETAAARARHALLYVAADATGGSSKPAQRARAAWVCQAIADGTTDGDLVQLACDSANIQAMYLAEMPALHAAGIALKLAQLITQLLRDFDGYPGNVQNLALASSALADAVILSDGGPIELPPGAMAGVPEGDEAVAAGWIARQEAITGFRRRPYAQPQ
jgi:hypothetical protein